MTWHYLSNQFLTVTERNYKKAYELSVFHDSALAQAVKDNSKDPDYTFLYNRYHPVHLAYVAAYTQWDSAGGNRQGETLNVSQLLALLPSKLDDWDPAVQIVYKKNTPGFKKIFPNKRKPFNSGTIDQRIAAVNTLAENIGDDPKLVDTKTGVTDFYTLLSTARGTQDGSKSTTDTRSKEVNAARIPAMQLQYAATGFFMNKFYENPEMATAYFDVQLLRDIEQSIFTGTAKPNVIVDVFTHTFSASDEVRIKATGKEGFTTYLTNQPGTVYGAGISVKAGEQAIVPVDDFKVPDLLVYRYVTIENTNGDVTSFEIEIE